MAMDVQTPSPAMLKREIWAQINDRRITSWTKYDENHLKHVSEDLKECFMKFDDTGTMLRLTPVTVKGKSLTDFQKAKLYSEATEMLLRHFAPTMSVTKITVTW